MSPGRSPKQKIQVELSIPFDQSTHSSWNHTHTYEQHPKNAKHDDGLLLGWESTNQTYTISSSRSEPVEIIKYRRRTPKHDIEQTKTTLVELDNSEVDADDEGPRTPIQNASDSSETEELSLHEPCEHIFPANEPGSSDLSVPPSLTRSTRIRFRSRVRITSGINRHKHASSTWSDSGNKGLHPTEIQAGPHDSRHCHLITPASSISASPSSSISAPLRSRTDDEADRPGWGPLGRRVSLFARKKKNVRSEYDRTRGRQTRAEVLTNPTNPNETSPLLTNPTEPFQYLIHSTKRHHYYSGSGSHRRRLSAEEVDEVFGRWPERTLNYRWWWWHAESIVCCRCLDESDDEYYN